MKHKEFIGELLTSLELSEVRLMEWGFTDVVHTVDEIVDLFAGHATLGARFRDLMPYGEETLWVDNLVSACLLYRVSFGPPAVYRSRFAESVRLLVKLRQRFNDDDWASAPELVSEVRFHLGPRRFPVREIDAAAAWTALSRATWRGELQNRVLQALFGPDESFKLAAFQLRAAERILEHYRGIERAGGTVITAGTGGGKTKAFYIPALMGIAADVVADRTASTKVLSIYPRNVLLADQFAEAMQLAKTVNQALGAMLPRPIRVGALIGDVPLNANFKEDYRNRFQLGAWPRPPGVAGHRVPHLREPNTGKPLVWLDADRIVGKTILRLEENTDTVVVPDGLVVLTRSELLANPPDILLTSIEMINKELSSEVGKSMLGFSTAQSSLRLILLDEIHTYEGLTGAQVPWILRRLSYWTRGGHRSSSTHVVGLSATLQDAPGHLATLSGIPESDIVEIAPDAAAGELTTEGQEYNVVLKSHPGSGAGVLATSIQTVMLGTRLLTPITYKTNGDAIDPAYFFGRKVFGFTDNLDVVNRWLPDFCDAEQNRRLASLRAARSGDEPRWLAGQAWRLSEQFGHRLSTSVRVGRTSSQDPGVDSAAEVVLATSALEVGFDDDEVGMVVQHKAPLSVASFLQRKGRAGRRKGMRPWTVVVLSDHGRDRWAFRDSERLFSPNLEKLSVPVFNPYVLRIQATWFLVDWIAARVGGGVPSLYLARRQYFNHEATQVVRDLIDKPELRLQLTRDLTDWIKFSQGGVRVADPGDLAQDLLWKPPRAVLRQVVPVLWNHLEGDPDAALSGRQRLLPQFLPERTWEVLDTQDVELELPANEAQSMDVRRALWECVPGRVSRRFAVRRDEPSKWLAWSAQLLDLVVPKSVTTDELLSEYIVNEDLDALTIFQPTRLRIENVPSQVKNSSNAEWSWACSVKPLGESGYQTLHTGPIARSMFDSGSSWLHRERSGLMVYRYSVSLRYEILMARGETLRGELSIEHPISRASERGAAVGFVRSVDGINLRVREDILAEVPELTPELVSALRPVYFRYLALQSGVLRASTSVFGISLLVTSAVGMAVATALRNQLPLAQAWALVLDKPAAARKVLDSVLTGEASVDQEEEESNSGRGIREVVRLWADSAVAQEMELLVQCLWDEPGEEWRRWLRATLLETIRCGVEVAVQSVLPEVPERDFTVEVVEQDGRSSVWILEAEAGGIGVIDRLLTESASDPHLFDTALEASLTTCRAERIAGNVIRAVNSSLHAYPDLGAAFAEVRGANSYMALDAARSSLVSALTHAKCDADKQAVTAVTGKVLMPGSSVATDRWLRRLTAGRRAASERLGVGIDPRLWAYWTTSLPRRRKLMVATLRAAHGQQPSDAQVTASVVRLTLDTCRDSCPECLGTAREMHGMLASRRLAHQWLNLSHADQVIDVKDGGKWLAELDRALVTGSRVRLRFEDRLRDQVGTTLATCLARRYDRGYILGAFRIAALTRNADGWELLIRIDDMEMY